MESRVVDLASQVTQNLAMVTEVVHTQRDFKDILLRLLNGNSNPDFAEKVVSDAPPPPTEPVSLEPPLSPLLSPVIQVAAAGGGVVDH